MAEPALLHWADRLAGRRVVVVGDVMLDEYLWGDAGRISAEAPVPVVEVRQRSAVPGGAGNAAANVVSLGGRASLGSALGADDAGRRLREVLAGAGIDVGGLVVDEGRPTTTKTRLLARGQQVVRIDHESRSPLPAAVEDALLGWFEQELAAAHACIVSDYGKGVISPGLARRAIERAAGRGVPVVVDPKGTDYTKYRGAAVIKPNVAEVERLLKEELGEPADLERAGTQLAELLPGTAVLVTRGPAGMALFRRGAAPWQVAAAARQVYDVTGAGDTVVSTLALALAAGAPLLEAIQLANHAAGLAVGHRGTAAVTCDELRTSLADSC